MEKWLIAFLIGISFSVSIYFYNNFEYLEEEKQQSIRQEYIIAKIDNLSAERDEENTKQTKLILNNISHLVTDNGELIKILIRNQSYTLDFNGTNTNMSGSMSGSGSISGIGKPKIIPSN